MKTPIEFDYDLWTTKDGKCMVRVKSTGETCEVSREAFRVLRAEEKRLRRSYTAAASDGDEAHPILSLNVLPEDSEKSPSWLTDHADFTDEVLTKMVIQEFRATLNSVHCAVLTNAFLGTRPSGLLPRNTGCGDQLSGTSQTPSEKISKKFCDLPDKRRKNVRCKVEGHF